MSSNLLKLDPFAEAMARREREEAEQKQNPLQPNENEKAAFLPSTVPESGRPHLPIVDGDSSPKQPSTSPLSGRQQRKKVDGQTSKVDGQSPSPAGRVDGEPSTLMKVDGHIVKKRTATKSDRHRGHKARYDNRIDSEIFKQIKRFLIEQGMDQQDFAELSAVHYMQHVAVHKNENVDGRPSLDDRTRMMMVYKTLPPIINLYLQYNPDSKWKAGDDRAGEQFNQTDLRLVELGILHTLLRTERKRIHSFAYFVPEIEETTAVPLDTETINIMLKRRREQYEKLRKERGT
jgi:hypothetical protein